MERIIQVKKKGIVAALTGLFLIVSMITGGCGKAGLEQPYNFAERSFRPSVKAVIMPLPLPTAFAL
ncbi:hypothetical protein [Clostridium sp. AM58-1XD]|uniref:hypothetical protein n=1 Tax=Clostridium sp. AM58-1XD TaxID=2292307 RepID=UPI0015F75CE2